MGNAKLEKRHIVAAYIDAYTEATGNSMEFLADALGFDRKTVSNWKRQSVKITSKNFNRISPMITKQISDMSLGKRDVFWEKFVQSLEKLGFSDDHMISQIKTNSHTFTNFETFSDSIMDALNAPKLNLQEELGREEIFFHVNSLMTQPQYSRYFSVAECVDLEFGGKLLIVEYPTRYHVGLILSNYDFTDYIAAADQMEVFVHTYELNMLLFFTDLNYKTSYHSKTMNEFNLFFEVIPEKELKEVRINQVSIADLKDARKCRAYAYGQLVFERFLSYQSVIRTEIIFSDYELTDQKKGAELVLKAQDHFSEYVEHVLFKEIRHYNYMTRHTLYFERNHLKRNVEELYKARGNKKFGTCIEICSPQAMLSSSITNFFENVKLLTSSKKAYEFFTNKHGKNSSIFMDNVSLMLAHRDPYLLNNQLYKGGYEKADLIILSIGYGSRIDNIVEYLRYINNWLTEDGMLYISFVNADSIVRKKEGMVKQISEYVPVAYPEDHTRNITDTIHFLSRQKSMSVEDVRNVLSRYMADYEILTFPFLIPLVANEEYDKVTLKEIRALDKIYADTNQEPYGSQGHYIHCFARKTAQISINDDNQPDHVMISQKIFEYLNRRHISYGNIFHASSIDSKSLYKSIRDQREFAEEQMNLLKVVITKSRKQEEGALYDYDFYVLPMDQYMPSLKNKKRFVSEHEIVQKFGIGTISPLIVLPELQKLTGWKGRVHLPKEESLPGDFVFFSVGNNTNSIKMEKRVFFELMRRADWVYDI